MAMLTRALAVVPRAAARALHTSVPAAAITKFNFPAMSPTMTEGGLAEWKIKEGQAFSQGDVLLDIETDKATMDVEAPEDGVLAKILVPNGTKDVPVGKLIALIAEEGDDLSNIEIPKEDEPASASAPAPEPAPTPASAPSSAPSTPAASGSEAAHPPPGAPYLPSVARLLIEKGITDPSKIKGTGLHGILTKGDILAYIGEASSPTGTYKQPKNGVASLYGPAPDAQSPSKSKPDQKVAPKAEKPEPLSGAALRALIIGGLVDVAHKQAAPKPAPTPTPPAPKPAPKPTFEDVLAGYV